MLRTNTKRSKYSCSSVKKTIDLTCPEVLLLFLWSLKIFLSSHIINKTREAVFSGPLYLRQNDVMTAQRKLVSCLRPINEHHLLHFTLCPSGANDERWANGPEMSLSLNWSAVNKSPTEANHAAQFDEKHRQFRCSCHIIYKKTPTTPPLQKNTFFFKKISGQFIKLQKECLSGKVTVRR